MAKQPELQLQVSMHLATFSPLRCLCGMAISIRKLFWELFLSTWCHKVCFGSPASKSYPFAIMTATNVAFSSDGCFLCHPDHAYPVEGTSLEVIHMLYISVHCGSWEAISVSRWLSHLEEETVAMILHIR